MIINQCLYKSHAELSEPLANTQHAKHCLKQFFTNILLPKTDPSLEKEIHALCPDAMDLGVSFGDLSNYELDKDQLGFNKLCMIRAENADLIIGHKGQFCYFAQLKALLEQLRITRTSQSFINDLHFYWVKSDTFLIACGPSIKRDTFLQYINALQYRCESVQKAQSEMPFLLRFVLVRNHPFLLERAYVNMQNCSTSQMHIVIDERFEDTGLRLKNDTTKLDELACIQLIQYALEHDTVVPYYQGMYNNTTGKIDKYEALMRIYDQRGQIYTPLDFMDTSKKYRLYLDLNLKMFQAVLRDFNNTNCNVSINLSVHDILSPKFRSKMRTALSSFQAPSCLTFELLEDECALDMEEVKEFMREVRSYGCKIAIDDFGSGYSNLQEIMKIRPDFIKIDGEIIHRIEASDESKSILEAMSLIGQQLNINLIAEFVETTEIQKYILEQGILYSQGYLFSYPKPFSELDVKNRHRNS